MKTKVIKITDPKTIKIIEKMMDDKRFIHRKIREGKINGISIERPDIKFAKPI